MGKLFEGFKILCTNFELILEKRGKLFKGGHSSRDDTNQGNIVLFCGSLALPYIQTMAKYYCIKERGSFTWKNSRRGGEGGLPFSTTSSVAHWSKSLKLFPQAEKKCQLGIFFSIKLWKPKISRCHIIKLISYIFSNTLQGCRSFRNLGGDKLMCWA